MEKNLRQSQKPTVVFRPTKRLGQHFLKNRGVLAKIVEAAELRPRDLVLEIGPGQGVLTQELAKAAGRVVAIEKDARLIPLLKENFKDAANVEIVLGDILEMVRKSELKVPSGYKLVANLPYYAATHIIRLFLESKNPPELMVLMVQKEVGQRICSRPPAMTLLGTAVQLFARPQIVALVPNGSFWPRPKVESAIIKLKLRQPRLRVNEKRFFQVVRAGFSQPRKQILNNFVKKFGGEKPEVAAWLTKNKISPEQRPATLSLEDWLRLAQTFNLCFPKVCAKMD